MNRIRQILVNLLGNAIKFTDQGHIALKVHAVQKSLTDVELHFAIKDTGVGIAEADLPKLFQMFSQVDASMARRFGGTGLGLAICKKLCILMDGSINVESEKGKGSTFSFQIPFKISKAKNSALNNQLEAAFDDHYYESLTSLRILVGEDNQVNRTVLLAFLAKIGDFKVDVKATGLEVFEAVQKSHYDLIFMDCQMPVMDGYEATRKIRSTETLRRIPIIALTANALEGDREKCLEAGMDDYISKPFQSSELSKALEKWLRQALEAKNTA